MKERFGEIRILLYSEHFYPMPYGVPLSSRYIARALVKIGYKVVVYTPTPLAGHAELDEGYPVVREAVVWKIGSGLDITHVLVNNGNFSVKAYFLARWLRAEMIQWFQMSHNPNLEFSFRRNLKHWIEKAAVGRTKAFVGVSGLSLITRPWIPRDDRSRVIFNCADSFFNVKEIPWGRREYDGVFVGRLTEEKGLNVLFEALELIEAERVACRILIVGDGPLKSACENRAMTFRHVLINFAGVRSGMDLVDCYDQAHCCIFPTTTHPEGLPLVLAEAATRCLSIIASDHSAAVEAVAGHATIYPRNDPSALAVALSDYVAELRLRNNVFQCAGSTEFRERFSFRTLEHEIRLLLRSV